MPPGLEQKPCDILLELEEEEGRVWAWVRLRVVVGSECGDGFGGGRGGGACVWWRRKKGRSECLCLVGSVQFSVRHIVTEVNVLNTKTRTRCSFDLAVDMDIEHFIEVHGLDNDDNGQGREKHILCTEVMAAACILLGALKRYLEAETGK